MGLGSLWHSFPPYRHTCQAPPLRTTNSLLVTACQASGWTLGRGQQPGFSLPQVDSYALRAEAYIQLCDFSSATQNLRRAYSFKPENTSYLKRLTLVLYLQVPGAAPGPCKAPTSHPGLLALPPAIGLSLLLRLVFTP